MSKRERNSPKDQGDVEYLARTVPLDPKTLRDRYEKELRPNLMASKTWHDGTRDVDKILLFNPRRESLILSARSAVSSSTKGPVGLRSGILYADLRVPIGRSEPLN